MWSTTFPLSVARKCCIHIVIEPLTRRRLTAVKQTADVSGGWGPARMKNPPLALTHKQMWASERCGSLTVPVIVVLLVAVTVHVQVRAAGEVETETRQEVRGIRSSCTVEMPHGTMASREASAAFMRITQPENDIGVLFQLRRWKIHKKKTLVLQHDWTSERKKERTRRQLIDARRANISGLACTCKTSQRKPRRKNVTLSQNEITLWCQIWAFLSNPHTELVTIPICCSPSLCLPLSRALIHSVYLTSAFHLWRYFMCHAAISFNCLLLCSVCGRNTSFYTRWTWSVTHRFFWRLLVIHVPYARKPKSHRVPPAKTASAKTVVDLLHLVFILPLFHISDIFGLTRSSDLKGPQTQP